MTGRVESSRDAAAAARRAKQRGVGGRRCACVGKSYLAFLCCMHKSSEQEAYSQQIERQSLLSCLQYPVPYQVVYKGFTAPNAWLNSFTLTFRALGRNHIVSTPSPALAMLCFHSTVGFLLSAPVLSRLFNARGKTRRSFLRRRRSSRRRSAGTRPAVPRQPHQVKPRTPAPNPQSQSFSRGYGSALPTSLIYIALLTRGCVPWRLDAVMSTTGDENKTCP